MATAKKRRRTTGRKRPPLSERVKRHGKSPADQDKYKKYDAIRSAGQRMVYGKNADIRRRAAKELKHLSGD